MWHPRGRKGKSSQCHRTRTRHFTGWELQIRAATRERSPELPPTPQLSLLWHSQSKASETITESASYSKDQLSNSPLKNIFCIDVFKVGFLKLRDRLSCCDRKVRGFGESSESLTPAWLSTCVLHDHARAAGDEVRSMGRSPRRVFYPLQYLCSSMSQGTREDTCFRGLKVLRNSVILGWAHKADPPDFPEVLFIQNAY